MFHLDGHKQIWAIHDEIHLQSRSGAPEAELGPSCSQLAERPQVLCHQGFQSDAANLFRCIKRAAGPEGAKNSGIEAEKLLVLHQLPLGPPLKHRQPKADQQILKNSQIAFSPFAGYLGFPGQVCQV